MKLPQWSRRRHLLTFVKHLFDVIRYMLLVGYDYVLTFAYKNLLALTMAKVCL